MASKQPDAKREPIGQSTKDKHAPPNRATADKPAGKQALRGPLEKPEKS